MRDGLQVRYTRDPRTGAQSREVWSHRDIGNGWVASYRWAPQAGGATVAELRIHHEGKHLPPGGLTTRIRGKASLGRELEERFHAALARLDVGPKSIFQEGGLLARQGFRSQEVRKPPPGRKGYDDKYYAERAARYVAFCETGERSPVQRMARLFRVAPITVNGWLDIARQRGLLTKAPGPGKAGGRLMPKAKRLLGREPEGER